MAPKPRVFTFDDFRGGEYGDLTANGAPPNSFTGRNVMRYRDGALGPRPGVKLLSTSSVPVGEVWALAAIATTRGVMFGVGSEVWGFTSPGGTAEQIGSDIATTPTTAQQMVVNGNVADLAVSGDKLYEVNPASDTTTALTGSPAAATVSLYGVRLMAASTVANPRRVYYSAPGDHNSWPALNFFDVLGYYSGGHTVTHIEELRQRLVIANAGGEWWALSGTPGVNDVLRRQPRGDLAPLNPHHSARIGEALWFLAPNEDFPVQYTGVTVDKLRYRHLTFTDGEQTSFGAASLPAAETVLFTEARGGDDKGLLYHNDVWSYLTFGVHTSRFVCAERVAGTAADSTGVPILFTDGGGVAASANFYSFHPTLNRPGKTGDGFSSPGDDSTTPVDASFSTPEQWGQQGEDLVVRTVIVDFEKWDTGSSSTNHFDVTVRALHRYNTEAYKDSAAQEFDEATADTFADATVDRRVFRFGDQGRSQGFSIRFDNLRGCAIRRFTVVCDTETLT